MTEIVQVVAAVIFNDRGELLIAKRPIEKHQGGLWEFPGGKLEAGETPSKGLKRELEEELGILIQEYQPLLQHSHDYVDKSVHLDIWRVTAFSGEAHGRENQEVRWINLEEIAGYQFPAANQAIVEHLLID